MQRCGRGARIAGVLLLALPLLLGACRKGSQNEAQITRVAGEKALIVSGSDTRIYHYCDCLYAKDIPTGRLQGFATPGDAERAGKTACMTCQPRKKYQEWSERQAEAGAGEASK